MCKYSRFFIILAVCLLPLLGIADEVLTPEPLPIPEQGEDRFFQEFMNMLTTLGLIVATIFFISWFLKRMVNSRIQQVNTTSLIKIVERRVLSPKASLYLVEIHDKQFVVGETASGIATLGEFPVEPSDEEKLVVRP